MIGMQVMVLGVIIFFGLFVAIEVIMWLVDRYRTARLPLQELPELNVPDEYKPHEDVTLDVRDEKYLTRDDIKIDEQGIRNLESEQENN